MQNSSTNIDMETRINEVVFLFYPFLNKSYELNKLAGREQLNTLKSYQTVEIH
jgi:hypothetical protein